MKRSELLDLCKKSGFVRYSRLKKSELIDLLERGSHRPKKISKKLLHSIRGPKLADFDWDCHTIDIEIDTERNCRIIRGLDLEGMFDSEFVNCVLVETSEGTRWKWGGWTIPESQYKNFMEFYRPTENPKSLFELAAHVVNSRKINQYLPKHILKKIKNVT